MTNNKGDILAVDMCVAGARSEVVACSGAATGFFTLFRHAPLSRGA
jgi:hypothetical protein